MADPHDPGFKAAGEQAAAVQGAAAHPLRVRGGGEVRAGTASWTDPTMTAKGVFYPDGAGSAEDRLRYYAEQFSVVEVDATYYALPQARQAELWAQRTPDGFVFDIKAHALLTGQPSEVKRLPKDLREALPEPLAGKARVYGKDFPPELMDAVWSRFLEGIEPLRAAGKLGAVFLQFPRWVFPSHEARELIRRAQDRLGDRRLTVEFRHGSWFNEKNAERTLRFLEDRKVPYVIVDEPQGFKSSVPPVAVVTSPDLAVFRFHGQNADTWEKPNIPPNERFRYLYDEDQLADWAGRVAEVARSARETHVLMNNCSGNYGTTNAMQLADLLRQYADRN
ncbi:MAG: DUF72 domain-containing protein [Candidatus Dormibacteraeota bacterium]|nr:DUF72 domain-containing protein [Candidatus Dormibacteraeota bacterium]